MKRLKLAYRYFRFELGLGAFLLFCSIQTVFALPVSPPAVAQITRTIDESSRVRLVGDTHPAVLSGRAQDLGVVDSSFHVHAFLQLKRSPEREQALEKFIDELHTPRSEHFHQWLTAEQFGELYGPAPQDIDRVTGWLKSHGVMVNGVYPSGMVIDFFANAAQVQETFGTQIHRYNVDGTMHVANASDPMLPTALVGVVVGIVSLNDFKPQPMLHKHIPRPSPSTTPTPDFSYMGTVFNHLDVAPADFNTIYNVNPLWSSGIRGAGQTVTVLDDSDILDSDWNTFRTAFGLNGYAGTLIHSHPSTPPGFATNTCTNPGPTQDGSEEEAALDAEWAGVAAPDANIQIASCADICDNSMGTAVSCDSPDAVSLGTFGVMAAAQNLINSTAPPAIISVSFGYCEGTAGLPTSAAYNSIWQQATTEGTTVFVSSGDTAAAGCDENGTQSATLGAHKASAIASTPYDVAVGGTDFGDYAAGTTSSYWDTNPTTLTGNVVTGSSGQALSYIPEIPWDESCANSTIIDYINAKGGTTYPTAGGTPFSSTDLCNSSLAANGYTSTNSFDLGSLITTGGGTGGPSSLYTKPSWQASVFGTDPSSAMRGLPDVSLFAAAGFWHHAILICMSDQRPADPPGSGGATAPYRVPCDYDDGDTTAVPGIGTIPDIAFMQIGGTSASAPSFAGIQALINQASNSRQGNVNVALYQLAAEEYGGPGDLNASISDPSLITCAAGSSFTGITSTCIFHDINIGDNNVPCVEGQPDCYTPSTYFDSMGTPIGTNCVMSHQDPATGMTIIDETTPCGILVTNLVPPPTGDGSTLLDGSTTPMPAYQAQLGWDYATGLGSVNANNLVNAFRPSALILAGYYSSDHSDPFAGAIGNILPAISVAVANQVGQTDTALNTGSITVGSPISIGGGLILSGTYTQPIINGVATFNDLSIDQTGTYTLPFTSSGFTATSIVATINPTGPASYLRFGTQPAANIPAGSSLGSVTVNVYDADGNMIYTDSPLMTVSLQNNPGSSTLSGTVTQTAIHGSATFSDLSLNHVGTGYTLTAGDASDGISGSIFPSTSFNIQPGPPTQLGFGTNPTGTVTGGSLGGVTVQVEDSFGNVVTTDNSTVTMALDTSPPGGTLSMGGFLSGTTSEFTAYYPSGSGVPTITGIATFPDLSVNMAGTYTLTATDAHGGSLTITGANSNPFTISTALSDTLTFNPSPADVPAGTKLGAITVQELGTSGSVITSDSSSIVTVEMGGPSTACGGMGIAENIASGFLSDGVLTFSSPQRFYTKTPTMPSVPIQLTASIFVGPSLVPATAHFNVVTNTDLVFSDGLESCRW